MYILGIHAGNDFVAATGEDIVLDTPFKIRRESLITIPSEGIRCVRDGGPGTLFLGNYLLLE